MNFKLFIRLISLICFIYIIYVFLNFRVDWSVLLRIRNTTLLIIILSYIFYQISNIFLWKLLQDKLKRISNLQVLKTMLSTLYLGYIPASGLQTIVRIGFLKEIGISFSDSLLTLTTNFILRYLVMIVLSILLFIFHPIINPNIFLIPIPIILLISLTNFFRNKIGDIIQKIVLFFSRKSKKIKFKHFENIQRNIGILLKIDNFTVYFIVLIINFSLLFFSMSVLWKDLGYHIPITFLMSTYLMSNVLGSISQVPGGIGVQETSYAVLLQFYGVSIETALIVSFLWRGIIMALDILMSLIGIVIKSFVQ